MKDEIRQLRFRANGLVLNCLDYGGEGKPPILFIHGGSAHAHWWDFVAPAFVDKFHVLALDQRGHGESEWPGEWQYSSLDYCSDLEQVIGKWGFGAPILIGHSMGAHNVLVYASRHSETLRAMVAIDTPPDYSEIAVKFLRTYADRPGRRFGSLDEAVSNFKVLPRETMARKEILELVARRSFRQNEDGSWIHKLDRRTLIREPLKVWDRLSQVKCPALIVKVTNSPVLDIEAARKMVTIFPKGSLMEIGDSFHHVMLDNPDALIETLKEFTVQL